MYCNRLQISSTVNYQSHVTGQHSKEFQVCCKTAKHQHSENQGPNTAGEQVRR